jgi:hypothetical protein
LSDHFFIPITVDCHHVGHPLGVTDTCEDDMLLGEIDSTYLKYHKVLLKRHPQPNMTTLCTLSIPTMMGQAT